MKYLLIDTDKRSVHSQSGIAYNKSHIHERRTMNLSELMLVTDGELYIRHIDDYHLVKNDILFLPQGIEHYGTRTSDCQLHWHHFFMPTGTRMIEESEIPRELPKNMLLLPMHFNLKKPETAVVLSYQLEQYLWTDENTQTVRTALKTALIGEIALAYKKQSHELHHKRLNSVLSYIDNNFQHRTMEISALADHFGYNKRYICTLFKKYLGISPIQYIINAKMKEARQMLLNSSDTVESIALCLHYDNPQYFMRQFKKHFGMTPSELRKQYSNSLELHLSTDSDSDKI